MIDLDDEDAFMASLSGAMAKQAEQGIKVGQTTDEPEPIHRGITVVRKPFVEPLPEPVEYEAPKLSKILATVDLETDPFAPGRRPEPFSAGFAIEADQGGLFLYGPLQPGSAFYYEFWGPDCVEQFFSFLALIKELAAKHGLALVVYAHNGGRFDFNYFLSHIDLETEPMIIGTQKVKLFFDGVEFRDSHKIIPLPLKKLHSKNHSKLDIDYNKMEVLFREDNREEILEYLKEDCLTLLDAVRSFIERFGWQITIASTALPLLQSYHGFDALEKEQDELIRPYYKGGRVQCFETGIIEGRFIMVDANSMYPSAMKNKEHPVSGRPRRFKSLDDPCVDFAMITATSKGCLGTGDGLLFDFTPRKANFLATIHEIRAGLETDTLVIHKVHQAWGFTHRTTFGAFVDRFYDLRMTAKAEGDAMGVEFYKLILNSSYGKLAMKTDHHKTFRIGGPCPLPRYGTTREYQEYDDPATNTRKRLLTVAPDGWRPALQMGEVIVWSRPKLGAGNRFINVATAASITGAARADLWRAICASTRPLYCDTDSVICEAFNGDIGNALGQWKVEATGDAVLIAGKKMYAFLSLAPPKEDSERIEVRGKTYYVVKKAHKGVTLTGDQIRDICNGQEIMTENMAPTFDLGGNTSFIKRLIKMTGNKPHQFELDYEKENA